MSNLSGSTYATTSTLRNSQQNEYYGYDENGRRMAKAQVSGGATTLTFYPFDFYEQRGSSSSGVTKYYFFAGERFAMRSGTGVANGLRLLFKGPHPLYVNWKLTMQQPPV
jgi:hypothetical protein